MPAAKTLGIAGGADQLGALVGVLGSGSDAVKAAAADSIGMILSRMDGCPDNVASALLAAVQGDGDVGFRMAAARAIGKAKLDPRQKGDVQQKLHRIAGSSTDG